MNVATNVIRFPRGSNEYNNFVEASNTWNSQFVYIDKSHICLSNERGIAAQEYLKDKHNISNGMIVVEIQDYTFEFNKVEGGKIKAVKVENYKTLTGDGLTVAPETEHELGEKLAESLANYCDDLSSAKVVVGTDKVVQVPPSLTWHVTPFSRAPKKYEYQLAGKVKSAQNSVRLRNIGLLTLFLVVTLGVFFISQGEETVVEKVVKKADPLKGYYQVLHGQLPSVRQVLQETVDLIEVIEQISGWKYREINFQQGEHGSTIVSAVLIRTEDTRENVSSHLKIDLMKSVAQFGYYMDLQRPDPVIFREFKNKGVYTAGVDSIPPVNIDQSVAYLNDAVTSIIRKGDLTAPSATESARISNGVFQERQLVLELNGSFKNHLDYASIIFSGWPVVFVGGKVDSEGANGKLKGRFTLTILGK